MRAYNLARSRMSDGAWNALENTMQRIAVYQALRTIDEEAMKRATQPNSCDNRDGVSTHPYRGTKSVSGVG
jgi:hypothetical protein